jgi:hypothetical protein
MRFTCRLCGHLVTLRPAEDDSIWAGGAHVLHEDGLAPGRTGVGYSFADWEVAVLGGFDNLARLVRREELRNPVCQYAFGDRMLNDRFDVFEGHRLPHPREAYDAWLNGDGPDPHTLPDEHDLRLGDGQVECVCGAAWPLLLKAAEDVAEGELLPCAS